MPNLFVLKVTIQKDFAAAVYLSVYLLQTQCFTLVIPFIFQDEGLLQTHYFTLVKPSIFQDEGLLQTYQLELHPELYFVAALG
jgi:hypothetical protein